MFTGYEKLKHRLEELEKMKSKNEHLQLQEKVIKKVIADYEDGN